MKMGFCTDCIFAYLALLICVGLISGCATLPPPDSLTTTARCAIPVIEPVGETKEVQEKGGLQISVFPFSYDCQLVHVETTHIVPLTPLESLMESLFALDHPPRKEFIEKTTTPVFQVVDTIRFNIKITNKLPRVFRGSGTVVQFNVGGKLIQVTEGHYAELIHVIVPPRDEQTVQVTGPSLSGLPDKTTIGIFLYDVVTKADAAGNVTERQNYEWYFNYRTKVREEEATITKTRYWP